MGLSSDYRITTWNVICEKNQENGFNHLALITFERSHFPLGQKKETCVSDHPKKIEW